MKFIAILVLGILIGCGVVGGYAYTPLQEAQQRLTAAETPRGAVSKTVKEQDEQLKGALAARSSLEADLRASKAQLSHVQTALKETKDQLDHDQAALEESKDKLAQAKSAKEAAEAAPGTGEKSYAPVDVARRSPVQS
jgi:septal ring factor EnvC (AmiA/AmiB activator)